MDVVFLEVRRIFHRERIPSTEPQKAEKEDGASPNLEIKKKFLMAGARTQDGVGAWACESRKVREDQIRKRCIGLAR